MADRVVRVRLLATVDEYKRGMQEAANATRTVGSEAEKLRQTREAMQKLGAAGVAMGAALAAGIGVAVARYAQFDQAMSNVAATGEDARRNIEGLREAALDAGARTVYSATEAANAIEELAKAGLTADEILSGGLDGALDLAAAGGLEVADAAGIAATALKVFNLEGSDMAHVADLLAAGAGKAMGDVRDLGAALAQGGQVAAATGLTIEETTAALAAFAAQGLLGSDAGTSFKTMLQRLTPQSAEAKAKMEELGVSAYDASGNFIGMAEFAGNLQSALADLTPEQRNAALATMFGSDAVRAANVVYQEGEEGIRKWITAVDDQGYAAEVAATRLDNLIGDWEKLTGALDTAFISMGEGANGPLRFLVQGLTNLVDGFNELPDWAKQSALGVGILTAGVGLLGGAFLLAVPKVVAFKLAMQELNFTGSALRSGLARSVSFLTGPWGIAMLGASAAVVGLQLAQDKLRTSTEEFQNVIRNAKSVDELFGAADSSAPGFSRLKEATKDAEAFRQKLSLLANDDFFDDFMRGADLSAQQLQSSLKALGDELATTAQTDLPAAQNAFRLLVEEYDLGAKEQQVLLDSMSGYKAALMDQANQLGVNVTTMSEAENQQALLNLAMGEMPDAAGLAAEAAETAGAAYLEEAGAVEELNNQLSQLLDAINESNGVAQDAISTNAAWQDALAGISTEVERQKKAYEDAHGTLDGFNLSLDRNTASGSANAASLAEVAAKAQDAAAAQFEQDKATMSAKDAADKYYGTLQSQRKAFIDAARAAGYNADEVNALADEVFKLPSKKDISIIANTDTAAARLQAIKDRLASIPGYKRITLETFSYGNWDVSPNANGGLYKNGVKAFAAGGFEPGIYPYRPGGIHKMAEEYDEAYISMDPARRSRSQAVWQRVGQEFGFGSQSVQVVAPSFEGLAISGRLALDSDGFVRLIDGRVEKAFPSAESVTAEFAR